MLENALVSGIKELEFWEMTPAEVNRAIESNNKVEMINLQRKASYDYIQAQLIVKGVGIALGSKGTFPQITEAYPGIFDDMQQAQKEKIQKQKNELSTLRFLQFAQTHNIKYKKQGGAKD